MTDNKCSRRKPYERQKMIMNYEVIDRLAEIMKYTFTKTRNYRNYAVIHKHELIYIERMIGVKNPWVSRNYIGAIHKKAGFKNHKVNMSYDICKTIIYFNLHWNKNLPKVLCNIILEFVGDNTIKYKRSCDHAKIYPTLFVN